MEKIEIIKSFTKKMSENLNFEKDNIIFAKNGTFKTQFTKTLQEYVNTKDTNFFSNFPSKNSFENKFIFIDDVLRDKINNSEHIYEVFLHKYSSNIDKKIDNLDIKNDNLLNITKLINEIKEDVKDDIDNEINDDELKEENKVINIKEDDMNNKTIDEENDKKSYYSNLMENLINYFDNKKNEIIKNIKYDELTLNDFNKLSPINFNATTKINEKIFELFKKFYGEMDEEYKKNYFSLIKGKPKIKNFYGEEYRKIIRKLLKKFFLIDLQENHNISENQIKKEDSLLEISDINKNNHKHENTYYYLVDFIEILDNMSRKYKYIEQEIATEALNIFNNMKILKEKSKSNLTLKDLILVIKPSENEKNNIQKKILEIKKLNWIDKEKIMKLTINTKELSDLHMFIEENMWKRTNESIKNQIIENKKIKEKLIFELKQVYKIDDDYEKFIDLLVLEQNSADYKNNEIYLNYLNFSEEMKFNSDFNKKLIYHEEILIYAKIMNLYDNYFKENLHPELKYEEYINELFDKIDNLISKNKKGYIVFLCNFNNFINELFELNNNEISIKDELEIKKEEWNIINKKFHIQNINIKKLKLTNLSFSEKNMIELLYLKWNIFINKKNNENSKNEQVLQNYIVIDDPFIGMDSSIKSSYILILRNIKKHNNVFFTILTHKFIAIKKLIHGLKKENLSNQNKMSFIYVEKNIKNLNEKFRNSDDEKRILKTKISFNSYIVNFNENYFKMNSIDSIFNKYLVSNLVIIRNFWDVYKKIYKESNFVNIGKLNHKDFDKFINGCFHWKRANKYKIEDIIDSLSIFLNLDANKLKSKFNDTILNSSLIKFVDDKYNNMFEKIRSPFIPDTLKANEFFKEINLHELIENRLIIALNLRFMIENASSKEIEISRKSSILVQDFLHANLNIFDEIMDLDISELRNEIEIIKNEINKSSSGNQQS